MTTTAPENPTPPPSSPDPGPRITRDHLKDLRRLRRTSGAQRTVGGVASGLARYFDVDPLLIKVAFVLLAFFGGGGLFLYVALWLLVPDDATGRAVISLDERSLSFALVGVAVLGGLFVLGIWTGNTWSAWPALLIVGAFAFWLLRRERRTQIPASGYGAPGYQMHAPVAGSQTNVVDDEAAEPSPQDFDAAPPPSAPAWVPPPPRPPDPRKKGPLLFWVTLPLIALAMGILGVVDLSGVNVAAAAYPALALGIVAAMLLLGAFWGRAGGLILLGFLLLPPLAIGSAFDHYDTQKIRATPISAAAVHDTYRLGGGSLILDLTQVEDVARLDGRRVQITGDAGEITVIVPKDLGLRWNARVNVGEVNTHLGSRSGLDVTLGGSESATHTLDLDVSLSVGQVNIQRAASTALNSNGALR